ncbi:hypothetical protein CC79DRAFT_181973 [Sarocladium strictum]
MQSNDRSKDLYPQEIAFPGSEFGRWPHSDDEADNADHSSAADQTSGLQPPNEPDSLTTLNEFNVVWNRRSAASAGAGPAPQGRPGSMPSHQTSTWRASNANRLDQYFGEAAAAAPSNVRIYRNAEVRSRSRTGDDEARESEPPTSAVRCNSKRQSTPPLSPAPRRARGTTYPGGTDTPAFEGDRHSPGRRLTNNDQARGVTPYQQTAYSGSRRRSPTPHVVFNSPSERQSADNSRRDQLNPLPRWPNRPPAEDPCAGQRRRANTETTSTLSTAPESTRSSNSRPSIPTTGMTTDQSQRGIASAADLVTATSNLTICGEPAARAKASLRRPDCKTDVRISILTRKTISGRKTGEKFAGEQRI